ncbi:hypothetical protein V2O64_23830 [Verrucomicrobiaceae bacterium 227]
MRHLLVLLSIPVFLLPGQEAEPLPVIPPPPVEEEELPIPAAPPKKVDPLQGIIDGDTSSLPNTPSKIKINGDPNLEVNDDGKVTVVYSGRVSVRGDNGMQAYANRAVYDQQTESIRMSGNVAVYQSGLVYRGESTTYYYEEDRLDTRKLRAGVDPILLEAGQFRNVVRDGKTILIGDDAGITTHDVQHPDFWIKSRKTTIIPGEKVIFQDFKLKAGDRSLFWLPYLAQPLDADLGFLFIPGGRSNLGAFLKTRYGVMLGGERDPITGENKDAWLLSQWHADAYTLRGLGFGVDFFDQRVDPKDHFGWLKLYYIHDFNSSLERAGVDRGQVTDERFRVEFAHRIGLWESNVAKYSLDANLTLLSDEYYLEDFDPGEFRINRAPDNYLALTRRTANSLTSLGARLRLNSFYQSDTRLPEITHDWIRQPLFDSRVLYESKTSLGFYEEHLDPYQRDQLRDELSALPAGHPHIAELNRLLEDRGFARFHTYHEASLPLKAGHFNIVPRAGAGHTSYSSVLGSGDSVERTSFFAGVDVSTKFSRDYPEIINPKWGIDGIRHIIQPYSTLSYLATDELDSSFGRIDRLTATTRPRTLRVGRFAGIDDLQDWSVLRTGVRNRVLTQRDGNTHEWLTLDTYFDSFFEDPEFNRSFSNLYNDLQWNPLPWLEVELETQFPLFNDSNFTEVASGVTFMPNEDLEMRISYRHLNAHPILRDSNQIILETFARLNEYWGIGTYHRYEAEDNVLELQQYNLHHDFDSFVGSVGLFHQNNTSDDEYGIMFSFGLKEIPSLSLPIEIGAE